MKPLLSGKVEDSSEDECEKGKGVEDEAHFGSAEVLKALDRQSRRLVFLSKV